MDRLDIGFLPVSSFGSDTGAGSAYTSALLIEQLSKYHDLTVYVFSHETIDKSLLPAHNRVQYVVRDNHPTLPHPHWHQARGVRRMTDELETHDLIHSYQSKFISPLSSVRTPTVVTLNAYGPVCPKGDLMWYGRRKCSGPSRTRCFRCIAATSARRRQGLKHELKSAYSSFTRLGIGDRTLANADGIDGYHVLSPHLRDDFASLGFPERKLSVIPHFYDEQFVVHDGDRSKNNPPTDNINVLYAGSLKEIKGVQVLIKALPQILNRGYEVKVSIAGSGPYEDNLRALADDIGVNNRIRWEGHVAHEQLPELYRQADVFVYPGLWDEPFGRVLLEAIGCRTPVVGSEVGSVEHILGDTGVVFERGDPEALTDGFQDLVENYNEYYEAIPSHLETFRPERVLAAFENLYATVQNTSR